MRDVGDDRKPADHRGLRLCQQLAGAQVDDGGHVGLAPAGSNLRNSPTHVTFGPVAVKLRRARDGARLGSAMSTVVTPVT